MKRLFTIRNLKCQYPGASKPVLEIDAFDVFKGELIFFLGASGEQQRQLRVTGFVGR